MYKNSLSIQSKCQKFNSYEILLNSTCNFLWKNTHFKFNPQFSISRIDAHASSLEKCRVTPHNSFAVEKSSAEKIPFQHALIPECMIERCRFISTTYLIQKIPTTTSGHTLTETYSALGEIQSVGNTHQHSWGDQKGLTQRDLHNWIKATTNVRGVASARSRLRSKIINPSFPVEWHNELACQFYRFPRPLIAANNLLFRQRTFRAFSPRQLPMARGVETAAVPPRWTMSARIPIAITQCLFFNRSSPYLIPRSLRADES